MAKIVGLEERQIALKEVNSKLNSLTPLNQFLSNPSPSGEYTIYDTSNSKNKITFSCSDFEQIKDMLNAYKKTVVADIMQLAEKYNLELDQEEMESMRV